MRPPVCHHWQAEKASPEGTAGSGGVAPTRRTARSIKAPRVYVAEPSRRPKKPKPAGLPHCSAAMLREALYIMPGSTKSMSKSGLALEPIAVLLQCPQIVAHVLRTCQSVVLEVQRLWCSFIA